MKLTTEDLLVFQGMSDEPEKKPKKKKAKKTEKPENKTEKAKQEDSVFNEAT